MSGDMVHIIKEVHTVYTVGVFMAPHPIQQYIVDYQKTSPHKVLISEANFQDALKQARQWEEQGVDVFISRRGTGDLLRQNVSRPVLTLPLSELEIIHCLRLGCAKGSTVFIPAFGEAYEGLEFLEELIGIRVLQRVYTSLSELKSLIRRCVEWQVDYVAGGGSTQKWAQRYGLAYIPLAPSKEQFMSSLESAVNVAHTAREKESMIKEMQGMMDFMMDGFVSVDRQGRVLACNSVALRLLGERKRAHIIGSSIFTHVDKSIFQDLLKNSHKNIDENWEKIVDVRGVSLVLHATLIHDRGNVQKVLISLRKVHDVLRQSGSIRSAISRGFETHYRLSDMICKEQCMQDLLQLCRIYAKIDSSVLICGETGTGKEILSQGIHNSSKRRKQPFVSINCAELPEHLLESELFGYDEGAFTGSRKGGKAGFFELAHGGTLLLDEIDSASTLVQSKLLRVLQEKEIMRIGGKRKIPIDVRVIATSGRDLWGEVSRGSFRKDLFFRLNVMSVYIPPLRQRIQDVEALFPHFVQYFSQREGMAKPKWRSEQMQFLQSYSWPGNIRQLRHFAERFVLYSSFMEDAFSHLYHELHQITFPSTLPTIQGGYREHVQGDMNQGGFFQGDMRDVFHSAQNSYAMASFDTSPFAAQQGQNTVHSRWALGGASVSSPLQGSSFSVPQLSSSQVSPPVCAHTPTAENEPLPQELLQHGGLNHASLHHGLGRHSPLPYGYIVPQQEPLRQGLRGKDEKTLIKEALEHARYSKQEAARLLGISRSTLWRKMRQHHLA